MLAAVCGTSSGLVHGHHVTRRCLTCDITGTHDGEVSAKGGTHITDGALIHRPWSYISSRRAQRLGPNAAGSIAPVSQLLASAITCRNTLHVLTVLIYCSQQHLNAWSNPEAFVSTTQVPSQASPGRSGGRDTHQSKDLNPEDTPPGHSSPTDTSFNNGPHRRGSERKPPDGRRRPFRSFNPFGQQKSVREINEAIKAELLRPHPVVEGFIYGFSHPENLPARLGSGSTIEVKLIKIGRSDNVGRRMREWRKQCKYIPRLVFAHTMAHHHKIERVVHHQLHNVRLREHFGCPGCGARHTEWFRIDVDFSQSLVVMWQKFTNQQPYDEFGNLLPDWLEKIERVDLDDPNCWSWFTCDSSSKSSVSAHTPGEKHICRLEDTGKDTSSESERVCE